MTAVAPGTVSTIGALFLPYRINRGSHGGSESAIRALASMISRIN